MKNQQVCFTLVYGWYGVFGGGGTTSFMLLINLLKFPNAYWISKNNLRKMNMDLSKCDICTLCLIVRASGPEMGLFVTSKEWIRAPE